jgi:hypothetical protein
MTTVLEEIALIKAELCHGCDGPITAFVLIHRAIALTAKNHAEPYYTTAYYVEAVANALDDALQEYGYLSSQTEIYSTGS